MAWIHNNQQRGALTLANGMVYIKYWGLDGDASDYIGRVVASRPMGQRTTTSYRVPNNQEAGSWALQEQVGCGSNYSLGVQCALTQGQGDIATPIPMKLSPTLK